MTVFCVLFLFGVFPFLLGHLWVGKGRCLGLFQLYIYGYFTMFALFEPVGVFFVHRGSRLSTISKVWLLFVLFLTAGMAVCFILRRNMYKEQCRYLIGNIKNGIRHLRWMVAILAFLMFFSLTMVISSPEDDVPEQVGIAIHTDTTYLYQPYTMLPYEDKTEKEISPLEIFYAVGILLTQTDYRMMIHMVIPLFLIFLYYSAGWLLSGCLFPQSLWERGIFTTLWGFFATVGVASFRNLAVGIFQNSWNGITLFHMVAVPLLLAEGLALCAKPDKLLRIAVIMAGAQLLYHKAWLLGPVTVLLVLAAGKLAELFANRVKEKHV